MQIDGLLSCPFCGGESKLLQGNSGGQSPSRTAYVVCLNCGAKTREIEDWGNDYIQEAIISWNRRISVG